jgi:hypothetical protein
VKVTRQKPNGREWIARRRFLGFQGNDDDDIDIVIQIGRPYRVSNGAWACPVQTRGLTGSHPDIYGVDGLQALCLAISLARRVLREFLEGGGRLLDPQDQEEYSQVELETIFGVAGSRRRRPRKNRKSSRSQSARER